MKRLVAMLLLVAALATPAILLMRPSAQASLGATITVNTTADTNARDGVLTLREAMLLVTGGLAVDALDSGECGQVSNSTYGPPCSTTDSIGAAFADTIRFDSTVFPPATPATITLGSTLPTLSTGSDIVSGAGAGVIVDGVGKTFDCLNITSNANVIRKLEIYHCQKAVLIHSGAQNNAIGGTSEGERNIISGNSTGVYIGDTGTNGNAVKGNYIGLNRWGTSPGIANQTGISIQAAAQGNTVGGTTVGERNVISGNVYGLQIEGIGTNGNQVRGNYIGLNALGTAPVGNSVGIHIGAGAKSNDVGGPSAGDRNVIAGHNTGVYIQDAGTNSNTVSGNFIGTNPAGASAIPNHVGVEICSGAQDNVIGGSTFGERNVISGNTTPVSAGGGVMIHDSGTSANVVRGNYIGLNASGDAAIPNDVGVQIWSGATNNTVGGAADGQRNVISGNPTGVFIQTVGTNSNAVKGNYIGTNASGTSALANGTGVWVFAASNNNTIGGPTEGDRNVISGNTQYAVRISNADGNTVKGNYIGVDATRATALPNGGHGVAIKGGINNIVGGPAAGDGNVIANNLGDGVLVDGASTTGSTIRGNSIYSNGGKGIENINGGNLELAPPVIDSVGSASGHTDPKCFPCTVEVFSDTDGQGRTYHGFAPTNDDATGTWSFAGPVVGPNITATVTHADGNTSEFSAAVPYSPPAVGGIAELPALEPEQAVTSSGSSSHGRPAVAGTVATAVLVIAAAAWYARERWLRRRA